MKEEQPGDTSRIIQDPEIMVGKPVVKGTRIPVERVIAHLAHNPDLNDLFAAYPELTVEDVKRVWRMRMLRLVADRAVQRVNGMTAPFSYEVPAGSKYGCAYFRLDDYWRPAIS
ncbi:MAG TPA: DUF433 domain-containing protein [Chloroflexota bacterium]|nr:DUF433 domain-containing protein [Chloroflexota bacterium]